MSQMNDANNIGRRTVRVGATEWVIELRLVSLVIPKEAPSSASPSTGRQRT